MHMRMTGLVAFLIVLLGAVPVSAATCESLSEISLPNTTITMAALVAPGALNLPDGQQTPAAANLSAFCRVTATLTPTSDSDIKIEVWMPEVGWNGKFHSAGGAAGRNSAVGGSINYRPMMTALGTGYATAGTDNGHTGATLSFAPEHPEKLIDFAYRAVHEMTVQGKAIIAEYYGNGPDYSYWNACAAGDRQGLTEVQRYPADYDGLIVSDPGNYWTHLQASSMFIWQNTNLDERNQIPPDKFSLIHTAALDACDAGDGVTDGVIDNPTSCRFEPAVLACTGSDNSSCLTAGQVEAAQKIYAPTVNSRTGEEVFPGLMPGSELGWAGLTSRQPYYATETFKYLVFDDPNWDPMTRPINYDGDVAQVDMLAGVLNANDPNLKPFFDRGGKIIAYAGWSDPLISPLNDVNYYRSVADALGGTSQIDDSYRLFMVPGMTHCRGGSGTDTLDMLPALERWVEQGDAPDRIEASRVVDGNVVRTRPLCPYPEVAAYTGNGSTDDAANFVCEAP